MNAWSLVFALALCASSLAQAESVDSTEPPINVQIADAMRLAHSGDVDGARLAWRSIAGAARETADANALDEAERALADIAFLRGYYAEVMEIYSGRMKRARATSDQSLEADALMQFGLVERRQGHLEKARTQLEEALALFRQANDRHGEGEALTHLGLVLLNQGQYVRAIEVLDASLALHRAGADVSVDRTYHYLGLLYLSMRDYKEANVQLMRALSEARRLPDPMRAGAPLGSLARLSNEVGKYAEALAYAAEAQIISERFGSKPGLSFSALERGRALLGVGRIKEARKALEESRSLGESVDQDRTAADATFTLGRVALAEGDQQTALQQFEIAAPNYEAAGDVPQLLDAYRAMVPLLRDGGNADRALDLAVASMALLEQISGRETSRRIALIEYRHEVEANQRRIEQLARENEIAALRLSQQEFVRNVGFAVILALLAVSVVLAWLYQRSRQMSRRLVASNAELFDSRVALAASHATLAEKAQALHVAATSDALTGIANRRHVLEVLEKVVASANTHGRNMAVMLIDVDRFKSINDRFGHGVGDRVLCRVVDSLKSLLPSQGAVGRYGGEEFLLVLPDHDLTTSVALAQSMLMAVRTGHTGEEPSVTLSIGVAVAAPSELASASALIEAADTALYRAKAAGRDRVAGPL